MYQIVKITKTSVRYRAYIPINKKKMVLLRIIIHNIYSRSVAWRQCTRARWRAFRCADTHLFFNKIALARAHKHVFEKKIDAYYVFQYFEENYFEHSFMSKSHFCDFPVFHKTSFNYFNHFRYINSSLIDEHTVLHTN